MDMCRKWPACHSPSDGGQVVQALRAALLEDSGFISKDLGNVSKWTPPFGYLVTVELRLHRTPTLGRKYFERVVQGSPTQFGGSQCPVFGTVSCVTGVHTNLACYLSMNVSKGFVFLEGILFRQSDTNKKKRRHFRGAPSCTQLVDPVATRGGCFHGRRRA